MKYQYITFPYNDKSDFVAHHTQHKAINSYNPECGIALQCNIGIHINGDMVIKNAQLQANVHQITGVLGERKRHSNGQMPCLRMRNLNYHPWKYKLIGWFTLVWYALCSHGLISYEIWKTESEGELDIFYDISYNWQICLVAWYISF